MVYVPALGGHVPYRDGNLRTTQPHIFVAGDAAGVEEASSAMVEGTLAGLSAAEYLGAAPADITDRKNDCLAQLNQLRLGHVGERIRAGLELARIKEGAGIC
jgi:sarcosine oxidase subunit alpha